MRNPGRCAVAILMAGTAQARVPDPPYRVGANGWMFERFGSDVAILRAPVSLEPPVPGEVGLLASCSGPDRRVRLSFPKPVVRSVGGAAIVTGSGSSDPTRAVTLRLTPSDPATMTASEPASPGRDVASTLGRMLLEKPKALDIIASPGGRAVALTHLMFYRLSLTLGPGDVDSVRGFLDACDRSPVRPPG